MLAGYGAERLPCGLHHSDATSPRVIAASVSPPPPSASQPSTHVLKWGSPRWECRKFLTLGWRINFSPGVKNFRHFQWNRKGFVAALS